MKVPVIFFCGGSSTFIFLAGDLPSKPPDIAMFTCNIVDKVTIAAQTAQAKRTTSKRAKTSEGGGITSMVETLVVANTSRIEAAEGRRNRELLLKEQSQLLEEFKVELSNLVSSSKPVSTPLNVLDVEAEETPPHTGSGAQADVEIVRNISLPGFSKG